MDMKVDPSYVKAQRERRAWSQEHLAEVAGLGLRTIQRIEKTGNASYESARSLAAVFETDVTELRAPPAAAALHANVALRPVLGVLGALVAGGALLATTSSFAADKAVMDVSVALDAPNEPHALATQLAFDGGLGADVAELRLGDLRFSIVPRVQSPDRILLEVGIYERRGDREFVVGQPQLVEISGEAARAVAGAGDERTLRLAITTQLDPPQLPPRPRLR